MQMKAKILEAIEEYKQANPIQKKEILCHSAQSVSLIPIYTEPLSLRNSICRKAAACVKKGGLNPKGLTMSFGFCKLLCKQKITL